MSVYLPLRQVDDHTPSPRDRFAHERRTGPANHPFTGAVRRCNASTRVPEAHAPPQGPRALQPQGHQPGPRARRRPAAGLRDRHPRRSPHRDAPHDARSTSSATATRYVIALTYGPGSQWVKNVLAAGGCDDPHARHATSSSSTRSSSTIRPATRVPAPVRADLDGVRVEYFLVLRRRVGGITVPLTPPRRGTLARRPSRPAAGSRTRPFPQGGAHACPQRCLRSSAHRPRSRCGPDGARACAPARAHRAVRRVLRAREGRHARRRPVAVPEERPVARLPRRAAPARRSGTSTATSTSTSTTASA